MTYQFVDCQCFAGGLTLGVVQSGWELVGKREAPGGFGVTNCENNRHILGHKWRTQAVPAAQWEPIDVPAVFGNPPCSGFSLFTGDPRNRGIDAKVNSCMWDFVGYAARCRPEITVMESVQGAFKQGHELMLALRTKMEELTGERYFLHHVMQDAYELGAAAVRPRYFMVMSKMPFGVEYPVLDYYPLIEDAWRDLDGMDLTWERQPYRRPAGSAWTERLRNGQVATDGHIGTQGLIVTRINDALEAMKPHGGWPPRTGLYTIMKFLHDHESVPDSSRTHVKTLVEKEWKHGWTQPLRWTSGDPGRVIVGGALTLAIHPWEDRLITHREAARLMGFPDDWRIAPSRKSSDLAPGWGKGVTVDCGRWIGEWVRRSLDGQPGELSGEPIGERETLITNPHPVRLTRGKIQSLTAGRPARRLPVIDLARL